MKMARSEPFTIFGAAISHTRLLRGSKDIESGSMSPKMMISLPVLSSRMKNAELSTTPQLAVSLDGVAPRPDPMCGERAGEYILTQKPLVKLINRLGEEVLTFHRIDRLTNFERWTIPSDRVRIRHYLSDDVFRTLHHTAACTDHGSH